MSATKLRVHVNAALAAIVAVGWFELPLVLDVLAGLGVIGIVYSMAAGVLFGARALMRGVR